MPPRRLRQIRLTPAVLLWWLNESESRCASAADEAPGLAPGVDADVPRMARLDLRESRLRVEPFRMEPGLPLPPPAETDWFCRHVPPIGPRNGP